MNAAQLIGQFVVKEAASGKDVVLESLWRDQRCVVMFFRRFACPYCRMDAVHLSKLKPQLDQANVRLVGIGHEKAGLEDFQKQEFFKGELYIDVEKNAYKALQFKRYGPHRTPCSKGLSGKGCLCRFNYFNIFPAILTSTARAKAAEAKEANVGGDLTTGDGLQTGGTLIVEKGGSSVLLNFKQESPEDYVGNSTILEALGITA
ncbi:prostamide/prostaglandin F synthase isoform X1 [Ixodes scapularis]|uniref:prostamide/prostaglandin F synthase isoform X1 n=1 Tax=Ixodes scapularis TaxID=6945 RepID=UPI001AD64B98|nr:prostamide/prostaglandin F synthase isoform X1 [Ixodes scapularis]